MRKLQTTRPISSSAVVCPPPHGIGPVESKHCREQLWGWLWRCRCSCGLGLFILPPWGTVDRYQFFLIRLVGLRFLLDCVAPRVLARICIVCIFRTRPLSTISSSVSNPPQRSSSAVRTSSLFGGLVSSTEQEYKSPLTANSRIRTRYSSVLRSAAQRLFVHSQTFILPP